MIGLIVGTVGGGGAILALPVLIYVLNEPVGPATTASLVVIAVAASVGAGSLARSGHICWRLALTFSTPAAAGSLAGAPRRGAVTEQSERHVPAAGRRGLASETHLSQRVV